MDQPVVPRLSVVIPVYNAEPTIARTLDSLLKIAARHQVQIVIINDGSTDRTATIVRSFAAAHDMFAWRLLEQANAGVSAARNAGLRQATGEWLYFLDGDDELLNDPLPWLDAADDSTCLALGVEYCRSDGKTRVVLPPAITPARRLDIFTACMPHPTQGLLIRRACVQSPFDEDIRYTEDWLFLCRNAEIFNRYRSLREFLLTRLHIHDANASSHYAKWGIDRARVASRIREASGDSLTLKQRNNLALQETIGRLQQRQWISPLSFARCPCNPTLYAKLWIYTLAALIGSRASPYRPPKPPR